MAVAFPPQIPNNRRFTDLWEHDELTPELKVARIGTLYALLERGLAPYSPARDSVVDMVDDLADRIQAIVPNYSADVALCGGRFDLVFAADCLFFEAAHSGLIHAIASLLNDAPPFLSRLDAVAADGQLTLIHATLDASYNPILLPSTPSSPL
ncbi:uncharacterized protein AMSG_07556 [Thecamonas trahens ATCC 50062]|uniref:Uncharacterized protein n=1 Tax=Thecamonas trahens ATCC 50062 TaxID=461836 RepID=A0A0L0DHG0_THETB|nr:hypothetical protein AMSG_07556 [Thecamonas trahens ATCC 50062]KNC51640.1 hypothetical protein AMSG_07556 [Thecamonas trahens ATCC 50062]|eukprot:XP_013756034.1 hypothetical protein AMSG_07556 [Thecamonas trahens ATCC 50062]